MITKSEYLCPKCKLQYAPANPPKQLINCPHSLCLNCLQEEIFCPLDNLRIQRRRYGVQAFETNHHLLKQLKQQSQSTAKAGIKHSRTSSKLISAQTQSECTLATCKSSKAEADYKLLVSTPNTKNRRDPSSDSPKIQKALPASNCQTNYEMCLLHSKKANLVCIEDKQVICADCGLFGEHKPHKLITYEHFVERYSALTEDCFETYKQLQQRETHLDLQTYEQELNTLLSKRREEELVKIKRHIRACADLVRAVEKQLVAELDTAIEVKRGKVVSGVSFGQLLSKKEQYLNCVEQMSQGLSHLFDPQRLEHYISFLDENSPNSLVQKAGLYLLVEIDNYHKLASEKMAAEVAEFQYQFRTPTLQLFLPTYTFISSDKAQVQAAMELAQAKQLAKTATPGKPFKAPALPKNPKKESPRQSQDQTLLLQQHNSPSPQKNYPLSPIENPSLHLQLHNLTAFESSVNLNQINPSPSYNADKSKENCNSSRVLRVPKSGNKPNKNDSAQKTKARCENESYENSIRKKSKNHDSTDREMLSVLGDKNIDVARKRKKLQLPQKEAKVFQQLLKDKLQVLDLGKGFLGNANILSISEVFPSRSRLKTVKLMDNNITDQIFGDLVSRCRSVQSLNLGGNQLTEKSLAWLEREVGRLGELRNITLSLNKIVLRNVKERLQELRDRGLTVSI